MQKRQSLLHFLVLTIAEQVKAISKNSVKTVQKEFNATAVSITEDFKHKHLLLGITALTTPPSDVLLEKNTRAGILGLPFALRVQNQETQVHHVAFVGESNESSQAKIAACD